jgi:hypothetical protein
MNGPELYERVFSTLLAKDEWFVPNWVLTKYPFINFFLQKPEQGQRRIFEYLSQEELNHAHRLLKIAVLSASSKSSKWQQLDEFLEDVEAQAKRKDDKWFVQERVLESYPRIKFFVEKVERTKKKDTRNGERVTTYYARRISDYYKREEEGVVKRYVLELIHNEDWHHLNAFFNQIWVYVGFDFQDLNDSARTSRKGSERPANPFARFTSKYEIDLDADTTQ